MSGPAKKLQQVNDFAKLANVTVRTLHYYDRINLLKPKYYDKNGFRLYGENEFTRLQQIMTLKFIGFSLSQIKEILSNKELNLAETLQFQRQTIEAQKRKLNLALQAIARAEKVLNENGKVYLESFKEIIEVINMEQNTEWTKKYYSETAQRKIEARQKEWSPELQEKAAADWKQLFSEVKSAIAEGVKHSDERAQKLARRWNALIDEFTGGDPEIRKGLNKMYADEKNQHLARNKDFDNEVMSFINKAMKYGS